MSYQNQSRGGPGRDNKREEKPPPRHPSPPGGWPLPLELEARRRAQALEAMAELQMVRTFIAHEFVEGVDYGQIPGTPKRSLWAPGAQKILRLFGASPYFEVESTDLPTTVRRERGQEPEQVFGHCRFRVHCLLKTPEGRTIGAGLGVASTLEEKFRYRRGKVACPKCGKEAIIKSKPPREGWWCNTYREGCGANFPAGDPAIEKQDVGKVETDPAEQWNTVLGMAHKRSLVDAAKTIGALADFLDHKPGPTWDLSELPEERGPAPAGQGVGPGPIQAAEAQAPPAAPPTVQAWYELFRPKMERFWRRKLKQEPALAGPAADPMAPPGPWSWPGFAADLYLAIHARAESGVGCEPGPLPDEDAPDDDYLAALRIVYDLDPAGFHEAATEVVSKAVGQLRNRAADLAGRQSEPAPAGARP